jgi:hypothetical protein
MSENKMSENKRDYEVGRGKPPMHVRFKKASPATRADRRRFVNGMAPEKPAGIAGRGAQRTGRRDH